MGAGAFPIDEIAWRSCAMPRTRCASRRVDITGSCGSRARSPISTEPSASDACISRKPCPTGRSPTTCAEQRDLPPVRYGIYLALTKAIERCNWSKQAIAAGTKFLIGSGLCQQTACSLTQLSPHCHNSVVTP